ncbi:hypothetical protein GCM10007860_10560 [Chitiniphilus shinanonensis]|uniref:Uncharacterized protein n=2 Tax=Chitiniphilus shinanonensis TaxID=553088 RepID=A0ABQ6BTP4_9NEIS|nr:hypothetical protein GCM10007860_10560 [Chitiniphilus shinanonensis]
MEDNIKRLLGVEIDTRINLGEICSAICIMAGLVWFAAGIEKRVALVEQQLSMQQAQQRERDERQDRQVAESLALLKSDLGEIKGSVNRLVDRELDRRSGK